MPGLAGSWNLAARTCECQVGIVQGEDNARKRKHLEGRMGLVCYPPESRPRVLPVRVRADFPRHRPGPEQDPDGSSRVEGAGSSVQLCSPGQLCWYAVTSPRAPCVSEFPTCCPGLPGPEHLLCSKGSYLGGSEFTRPWPKLFLWRPVPQSTHRQYSWGR